MALYRATCVAIANRGVLLEGPSGAGKSDLALRLIAQGAKLVSDDYVELTAKGRALIAAPPGRIAGKLEVRGLGLVELPYRGRATVALAVELVARGQVPRLPDETTKDIAGVAVPVLRLHAFDASTPAKIRLALGEF